MKLRSLSGLLLAVMLAPLASADIPNKVPDSHYSKLWTDSPFTTPKEVIGTPPPSPFEDYALSAVSPVEGGYFVVLQNKKKPEDRFTIQPGYGNPGNFTVTEVRWGSPSLKSTTVMLSNGSRSGLVGFDEKLLVIKQQAQPRQGQPGQQGQPNQQGGLPPGMVPPPVQPVQPVNVATAPQAQQGNPGGGRDFGGGGGGRFNRDNNNGSSNTSGNAGGNNGGGREHTPRPRVIAPTR